ncbi:OPT oligopeptide transporter protein-domain-containing protein, partial [Cladochytrium replicatum]
ARVWILGTFWCVGMAAANAIFSFRTNSITLDPTLATLLTYPIGLILAKILPTARIGSGKFSFTLNPGPFSIKEHVLVSVMATAGSASPYAMYNVVSQRMDMFMGNDKIDFAQSFFWVITTQLVGFGMAGLARRFLVKPAAMLWPGILSQTALFVSLHKPDLKLETWKISRFNFFWIALGAIFVYELIPNIFATALQAVALLCLFSKSGTARFLGSVSPPVSGPGLLGLTFDLQYIGSGVFLVPWIYQAQSWIGNYFFAYIVAIPAFFTNPFGHPRLGYGNEGDFYPDTLGSTNDTLSYFNSVSLFDKTGTYIRARALYQKPDFSLNITKYSEVGPIYISDFFAITYMIEFMVLPAMVAHVVVWYGKDVIRQFKAALKQVNDETDIHNKLMAAYPDIPEWFYGGWLLIWTIALCLTCAFTEFRMPVWGVLLATVTSFVLIIPIGIVLGVTGTQIYLNVLQEFVAGLLMPGDTVAVMCYKSIGVNTAYQAITLLADLKQGHYLKIPPISMFASQIYGTILGSIVYLGVAWWMMFQTSIELGGGDWQVLSYLTFYNAGAIWGAIAPARFFGIGSVYEKLLFGFLAGFGAPVLVWGLSKLYPSKYWHMINIPVIVYVTGAGTYQNFYIVAPLMGFIFSYYLLKKAPHWWKKYNYVLAAAQAGGVAAAVLFATALTANGVNFPIWALNPDPNNSYFDYYCYGVDMYGNPAV